MSFEVKKIVENVTSWIAIEVNKANKSGCVVGISGGKDSGTVLALLVKALGKENVIGVLMPNGVQEDYDDAKNLVEKIGVKNVTCNVEKTFSEILNILPTNNKKETGINILPRLRMTTLYAIASENNYLVAGTSNLSEIHIGYSTKWGDSASDFNPIGSFTTEEVVKIGKYLKVIDEVINKPPSDGLSGKSDEEKIGFSYYELNNYLRNGLCSTMKTKEKIDKMHNISKHKREKIPTYQY